MVRNTVCGCGVYDAKVTGDHTNTWSLVFCCSHVRTVTGSHVCIGWFACSCIWTVVQSSTYIPGIMAGMMAVSRYMKGVFHLLSVMLYICVGLSVHALANCVCVRSKDDRSCCKHLRLVIGPRISTHKMLHLMKAAASCRNVWYFKENLWLVIPQENPKRC